MPKDRFWELFWSGSSGAAFEEVRLTLHSDLVSPSDIASNGGQLEMLAPLPTVFLDYKHCNNDFSLRGKMFAELV